MQHKDELYHYGVKGMKWKGHVYATKDELKDAKRQYKQERKDRRLEKKYQNKIYKSLDYKYGNAVQGNLLGMKYYDRKIDKTYAKMKKQKGQEFADRILANTEKKYVKDLATVAAVSVGSSFLERLQNEE